MRNRYEQQNHGTDTQVESVARFGLVGQAVGVPHSVLAPTCVAITSRPTNPLAAAKSCVAANGHGPEQAPFGERSFFLKYEGSSLVQQPKWDFLDLNRLFGRASVVSDVARSLLTGLLIVSRFILRDKYPHVRPTS